MGGVSLLMKRLGHDKQGRWERFLAIFAEIEDLQRAAALLSWDQQTYMPAGGAAVRAEQLATLGRLAHERLASPELGELLDELERTVNDDESRAMLRVVRRTYDQAVKVPAELTGELSRATSQALAAWEEAKRSNRFDATYQELLAQVFSLTVERAQALGYNNSPYEALIDQYEPGINLEDVEQMFVQLKAALQPLTETIAGQEYRGDASLLRRPMNPAAQRHFNRDILERIGFDFERGRLDESEHPFTIGLAPGDVRLTTRIDPDDWSFSFFAALHEAGHGLYDQGLPEKYMRTPIGSAASLGIHESQSLLWENVIGRSQAFWRFALPRMQFHAPGAFDGVSVDGIYRAVNRVQPSLIRVTADEVTYSLHVLLRFELEKALVEGDLMVPDLPAAWNEKMQEYLGIQPSTFAEGVLQDVHWSHGLIGYFPTYSIGMVLAVQFFDQAVSERPEIAAGIPEGRFEPLRSWLSERIHSQGARYLPSELVQHVTGRKLDVKPFLDYLQTKYGELYEL